MSSYNIYNTVMEQNDTNDDIIIEDMTKYYGRKHLGYLCSLDFNHGLDIDLTQIDFTTNDINEYAVMKSIRNYGIEFETKLDIRKCCENVNCNIYEMDVYIDNRYVMTRGNESIYVLKNIKEYEELRVIKLNKLKVIVEEFIKIKYQKYHTQNILLQTSLDTNVLSNIMNFL